MYVCMYVCSPYVCMYVCMYVLFPMYACMHVYIHNLRGGFRVPTISRDRLLKSATFFSANYKTVDFGPICQENAWLAL